MIEQIRIRIYVSSLNRCVNEFKILGSDASFVELQVHDNLTEVYALESIEIPAEFKGYLTFHGEGETDGKRKIKFCFTEERSRKEYVKKCIDLYSVVSEYLNTHEMMRLILHPDSLSRRVSRRNQLELLALSLSDIRDKVSKIDSICIEPRGGDRQGKVLRTEIEDIRILEHFFNALGLKKSGLCIDIAQLFVVHGNSGAREFLKELKSIELPVMEFHVSDVVQNSKIKNRVAMEIGTGIIDWKLILPLILKHCNDLLVETLGGIKVFQRSKSHLESVAMRNNNEVSL